MLGLPGKFGLDGSKVAETIDAGDVQAVRDYCEADVLNTYLVYLRHMLHRGSMTPDGYNKAIADIVALIGASAALTLSGLPFLGPIGEPASG